MHTKLTLRIDADLINKAKRVARQRGKSLSKMVAEFFKHLSEEPGNSSDLPPNVKKLYGSLKDIELEEKEYYDYLERKHR